MRILIADDRSEIIENLSVLISLQPDMQVSASASNGREAYEKCGELQPDIAILDMNMPQVSGLEAGKLIKKDYPMTRVALYTNEIDGRIIIEAIKSGIEGYIFKDTFCDELINLLRSIYNGNCVLSGSAGRILADELARLESAAANMTTGILSFLKKLEQPEESGPKSG